MRNKLYAKNKRKYEKLENEHFDSLNLLPDEQIVHCIDDNEEQFYLSGWLVTNKGRVWSLNHKRWLVPWYDEGYWRVANVYVHKLVDYYFITEEEKNIKKLIDEHNAICAEFEKWRGEVHHLIEGEKFDYKKMTDAERISACMAVNYKENLMFQIDTDHDDDHRIMKGDKTIGMRSGVEQFDAITYVLINSKPENVKVTYSDEGKRQYDITIKLKGTTPEEEEELDKITHNFKK